MAKPKDPGISCTGIVKDGDYLPSKIGEAFASLVVGVDEFVLVRTGRDDGAGFDEDYPDGHMDTPPDWLAEACDGRPVRVYRRAWDWDFSAARNHGLDRCRHEWVFVIDADERMDHDHVETLRELTELDDGADGYFIHEYMHVDGVKSSTISTMRLYRNKPKHRYRGFIHNQLAFDGMAGNVALVLHHYSTEALEHANRMDRNSKFREKLVAHLAEHPDDLENHFNYLKTCSYDRMWDEILDYGRRFIERLTPKIPRQPTPKELSGIKSYQRTWYMVGLATLLHGNNDEAYELGTFAAQYLEGADIYFLCGNSAYMRGDYPNAYMWLRRYLERLEVEKSGAEHVVIATESFEGYARDKYAVLTRLKKYGPRPLLLDHGKQRKTVLRFKDV